MARGKKGKRRVKLLTKVINVGVLALAFWPAIQALMAGKPGRLVRLYSAGMVDPTGEGGAFDKGLAIKAYGPIVAAIILKKAISMVRKTVRV